MNKKFCDGLRASRGNRSQSELADKIGVSQVKLSRWESGKFEPNLSELCTLCKTLGVTSDWLLGLSDVRSGGGVQTPPRDAEVARLWALVESQQRTIEALANGGGGAAPVRAASSASSRREATA